MWSRFIPAVAALIILILLTACGSAKSVPAADMLPDDEPAVIPLEGPIVVALQPGHWKIDELPAEARRRPRSIGAVHAGVREVDINLAVVDALVPLLEEEGWRVFVVPATVPPGLRADAFISVHADWGGTPARQGWKLAPPWRPSRAANRLADSLRASFADESNLVEDVGGVTVGMRGYFGFSSHRYTHASSPYTPAVLVELGFVTNQRERELMSGNPEYYAAIIHRGLERHFYRHGRAPVADLVPTSFPILYAGSDGVEVRNRPSESGAVIATLEAGTRLRPVDEAGDWYEFFLRNPWRIGFIHRRDLAAELAQADEEVENRELSESGS